MITVKVHTILGIKKIIGQRTVDVELQENSTLSNLIDSMVSRWGEPLSSILFQPESKTLYPYIRLAVNGRDILFLNGMETVLKDGDEILLFPPVSGG